MSRCPSRGRASGACAIQQASVAGGRTRHGVLWFAALASVAGAASVAADGVSCSCKTPRCAAWRLACGSPKIANLTGRDGGSLQLHGLLRPVPAKKQQRLWTSLAWTRWIGFSCLGPCLGRKSLPGGFRWPECTLECACRCRHHQRQEIRQIRGRIAMLGSMFSDGCGPNRGESMRGSGHLGSPHSHFPNGTKGQALGRIQPVLHWQTCATWPGLPVAVAGANLAWISDTRSFHRKPDAHRNFPSQLDFFPKSQPASPFRRRAKKSRRRRQGLENIYSVAGTGFSLLFSSQDQLLISLNPDQPR